MGHSVFLLVSILSLIRLEEGHCTVAATTLRFAAIVTRHGTRSPIGTIPLDGNRGSDSKFWPNGFGELTDVGIQESFKVGRMLRKRYNGLLSDNYNPDETQFSYCQSYGRDYRSALCTAAGLYPQEDFEGDCRRNKSTSFEVVPREFDIAELATKNLCPQYRQELFKLATTKIDVRSLNDKSGLAELLVNETGLNEVSIVDTYYIFDAIHTQLLNKRKMPNWSYKIYPDPVKHLSERFMLLIGGGSERIVQLGAGPELKHLSDQMMEATQNPIKKLYIESAHDITLLSLLISVGYTNRNLESKPGSYLAFELHHIDGDDFRVKVFFFESPEEISPIQIPIQGCQPPCTIEQFSQMVDSINPDDWAQECIKQ